MKFLHKLSLIVALVLCAFASQAQSTVTVTSNRGDTICAGTNVVFHATATPMDTTLRYRWILNGSVVGGTMPFYANNALVTGDVVYCLLTNAVGDTIIDTSNYHTMTVNASVHPSMIAGPDSVCIGGSITVYDSVAGGFWHSTNTSIFTVDSVTGVITSVAPGQARVVYTITTGSCPDSVRLRIRVDVPGMPLTGPSVVCIDSMFRVFDTARGGTWTLSDATLAMPMFQPGRFQATAAGTLTIHHNVNNACGVYDDSMTLSIINCDTVTAVHTVTTKAKGLSIVPNPAGAGTSISVSGIYGTLTITDITGRVVRKEEIAPATTYTITGLVRGVYVLSVLNDGQLYTGKLVVE